MQDCKIVPMGEKQWRAMNNSLVMPYAKSERKRQLMHSRFNYGINEETVPTTLPKAKNLSRRARVGKYMGLNNIESLVSTPVKATVVPQVEVKQTSAPKVVHTYQKYVFRHPVTGKVLNYASAGKLPHSYR